MNTETHTITLDMPAMIDPMITVTESAAGKIRELLSEEGKLESGLRVFVQGGGCSGFQYGLMIEEGGGVGDQLFESNGVRLFVVASHGLSDVTFFPFFMLQKKLMIKGI